MRVVVLGLSITSAWGNGHASTYRHLVRALSRRGHDVLFLERDMPWYAANRDCPAPAGCQTVVYDSPLDLESWMEEIRTADLVMIGSYVPDGAHIADLVLDHARGVKAFYDIDTPITLAMLERGDAEYLRRSQIARFDVYWSFSGGPILERLERQFGAPRARPLYCSIDPDCYPASSLSDRWRLGYLGTYSEDRQAGLDMRLLEPARRLSDLRFVVAGAQFPSATSWPPNVDRFEHVPPEAHGQFFASQRYTLNLTRRAMVKAGYSPSVRLFEAAAAGVAIISDTWPGLETFFTPGEEILVSRSTGETIEFLLDLPDEVVSVTAARARQRVLAGHTSAHRAQEIETVVADIRGR